MNGFWQQTVTMWQVGTKQTEFTPEDLAKFDGKEGRPAYVAVHDVIYDLTPYLSGAWAGGLHFGILAGTDATKDFDNCHNHSILEKLMIVGRLVH